MEKNLKKMKRQSKKNKKMPNLLSLQVVQKRSWKKRKNQSLKNPLRETRRLKMRKTIRKLKKSPH